MANFALAGGARGGGFSTAAYSMTLAQHSRRAVWLDGQGPGGTPLQVVSANPAMLRVIPSPSQSFTATLPANTTEFWIDGLQSGTTQLRARLADGQDYSAALPLTITASNDVTIMEGAFRESRGMLSSTIAALSSLNSKLLGSTGGLNILRGLTLSAQERTVLDAAVKWLNVPDYDPRRGPTEHKMWVTQVVFTISSANRLYRQNLDFTPDFFVRTPEGFHANVWGRKELGIECGESFFSHDGPLCRKQVLIHEIMHLFGIGHGIDPGDGPTIHRQGITPQQSLNSADNLAQLAAHVTDGKTDSCTRVNE